jgi:hypothetical protein
LGSEEGGGGGGIEGGGGGIVYQSHRQRRLVYLLCSIKSYTKLARPGNMRLLPTP